MKREIYFLLGFGGSYGYGHLSRCSNLAYSFKKLDFKVNLILTNKNNLLCKDYLAERWLGVFEQNINFLLNSDLGNNNDPYSKSEFINELVDQNILILDDYYINKNILKNLFNVYSIIQFKDDINDPELIDVNNKKNKIFYFLPANLIPDNIKIHKNIFYGLDLFPLFPSTLKLSYPKLFLKSKVNIFFSPGSAICNSTNKIFESLISIAKYENINFYIPESDFTKGMKFKNIFIVNGRNGIADYLYFANLVITAAGNTMLEAFKFGTPMIIYCTNNNQYLLADYLSKKNKNIYYLDDKKLINYELIMKNYSKRKISMKAIDNLSYSHNKLLELIIKN